MGKRLKIKLAEQVAQELQGRIMRRELIGPLPGVRNLALLLGVSTPTICQALHWLEESGWVKGGGEKRRWHVIFQPVVDQNKPENPAKKRKQSALKGMKRLLFLASLPLSSERQSGIEIFAGLTDLLGSKGWVVIHRALPFEQAKSAHKSWDTLLDLIKPDAMIVLGGSPTLGRWARKNGLRTLFLGGVPGDSRVPMISISLTHMLQRALERLLFDGHRKIILPICGRSPEFATRVHNMIEAIAADTQNIPNHVVVIETSYSGPEVLVNLMGREWRKAAPDAMIFLDWREFIAASAFFQERRIKIPQDLSVVILSNDEAIHWHLPPISHFEYPLKHITRMVSKWAISGRGQGGLKSNTEAMAVWNEGKSIQNRKYHDKLRNNQAY